MSSPYLSADRASRSSNKSGIKEPARDSPCGGRWVYAVLVSSVCRREGHNGCPERIQRCKDSRVHGGINDSRQGMLRE